MSTYVIQKGSNYHVSKNGDGYLITFSQNGKLISQSVNGSVGQTLNLGFLDEEITLSDGKTLKRVRENLTIGE